MLDYLELGDEEELHLTPNPVPRRENEVIMEIEEMADISTLSTLTEPNKEREVHAEQTESPSITTTEREIHAKQANPPPAGDTNTTHERQGTENH
jgi:hypothetical protein